MPQDLHPKEAAWLREQVRQEVEHRIAPMRRELDSMDDWANGVFAALLDLLLPLLKTHPELARTLEAVWRRAAEEYDDLERQPERSNSGRPELLEARRMLYWVLAQLGQWPPKKPRPRRRPAS